MTYTPKRGYFPVGLLTSNRIASPSSGTITLDEIRTSAGLYGASATAQGLAISETQAQNYAGLGPFFSSGPSISGGLGTDLPAQRGSRACAGTMGGAHLNNATMLIYYESYDTDRVLANSYLAVFGGFSS